MCVLREFRYFIFYKLCVLRDNFFTFLYICVGVCVENFVTLYFYKLCVLRDNFIALVLFIKCVCVERKFCYNGFFKNKLCVI